MWLFDLSLNPIFTFTSMQYMYVHVHVHVREECVAPYMGARGFTVDLNSHLTDSRLPSRAHEKSIEPSNRQTCKKAQLPAQYTVFRGIHPSSVELE